MLPHVLFNFRTNNRASFPVTTGLQMHYDGDAGNTFTKNATNDVSQWRDRSGFSRHAAQATSNQQPKYTLNTVGGKVGVVHDGSNDFMLMGDGTLSFLNTSSMTIVIVCNRGQGGIARTNLQIGYNSATSFKFGFGSDDLNAIIPNVSTGTTEMFVMTYDSLSQEKFLRRNKVEEASGAGTASISSMTGQSIARYLSSFSNISVGEIAIFNRVLSPAEITLVETSLAIKWQVV
jgi:hypothetical protein